MNYRIKLSTIVMCLFAMVVIAGCAKTKIERSSPVVTEKIPKPATVWVYAFAATASDVPADSALAGESSEHATPQTPEHIATGRKLGDDVAKELVAQIKAMGVPAEVGAKDAKPQVNDLVIKGTILSFEKGDATKRVLIGLGDGSSELKAAVEGFQMTAQGLRKLGGGTADSEGAKTPGGAVGAATLLATHNPAGLIVSTGMKVYGEKSGTATVEGRAEQMAKEIADQLKDRFKEQGWIE